MPGTRSNAKCVAAADDGHVLTGSDDKTVKVWRGDELVRTIEAHTDGVTGGGGAAGRRALRQRLERRTAAKLFTFGGELERTFEVGSNVLCVAALPDGVHFVVGLFGPNKARSGCTTSTGRSSTPSRGTPTR